MGDSREGAAAQREFRADSGFLQERGAMESDGGAAGEAGALSPAEVYERLFAEYGAQGWWPADSPFEVMVGAVLVQGTAWANVERAIANLRDAGALSPRAVREMDAARLEALVKPSGFFRVKARRLRALCEFLGERFADDLDAMAREPAEALRREILGVNGVGEETADDILLYALGVPVFVIDAYTRRALGRLGTLDPNARYADLQRALHAALPRDAALFNEYHALIVRHAVERCRKRAPLCAGCPLSDGCRYGRGMG